MADWTLKENEAIAKTYFDILAAEKADYPYVKAHIDKALREGPLASHSKASVEEKFRNISYILDERGERYVRGYLPAKNTQQDLEDVVKEFLNKLSASHPIELRPPVVRRPAAETDAPPKANESSKLHLKIVRTEEEIRNAISRFNRQAFGVPGRAKKLLSQTTYWAYDSATENFAPNKFAGFVGLSLADYDRAHTKGYTGITFDGGIARKAIERALGRIYKKDDELRNRLIEWVSDYLDRRALKRVDTSKWRFVKIGDRKGALSRVAVNAISETATEAAETNRLARSSGQGFSSSPAVKKAVEMYAMARAKEHFQKNGYTVEVRGKPFDLLCTKVNETLYVEVKGTVGTGERIFLTRNEVRFARENAQQMVLYLVEQIELSGPDDSPVASGGVDRRRQPWSIFEEDLSPITYEYLLVDWGK